MELIDMGLGLEGTHVLVTGAAGFIGTIHTSLLPGHLQQSMIRRGSIFICIQTCNQHPSLRSSLDYNYFN